MPQGPAAALLPPFPTALPIPLRLFLSIPHLQPENHVSQEVILAAVLPGLLEHPTGWVAQGEARSRPLLGNPALQEALNTTRGRS